MLGPVAFQEQLLKRQLWGQQRALCRAVATHTSTSVKGCHGSGKSYAAAGLIPWWLLSDEEAIVLTIAPTLRQVKTFWNEVHTAIEETPVRLPEPTTTGLEISGKNYALGFSSSKGVNAQGFHGKRVLILADEAIGISADVWDAIEGIRAAGDVSLLKLCNPTAPTGAPYEDFTRLRATTECITISAFDTPNLAGLTLETLLALPDSELDYAPFPWLTRRRWVREMYYKWGPTNPRFLSRVLGEFPTQATDAVFPLAAIEGAGKPWDDDELKLHMRPGLFIQIGIDVAGPGDDETVATARMGPFVIAMEAWPDADPLQKVFIFMSRLQKRFPGAQLLIVGDTVGIGYYFMRDIARAGYLVYSFVANGKPLDPVQYWNAKAEAHFTLREYMIAGEIRGVLDEDTKAQLSDLRYRERAGRIEIESKAEMRARGASSPDRAESLVMAFTKSAVQPEQSHQIMQPVIISPI